MNLRTDFWEQTDRWRFVFPQPRSLQRALALAFGILCRGGRRTLTRAISSQGNTQKDWSADYKVFSRSPWQPRALFHPILEQALQADELPNQELAKELAARKDRKGIQEIAVNLWNENSQVQSDCLKVLYEIGYLQPELIAPYADDFLRLLHSRNNGLVWGAMIAL